MHDYQKDLIFIYKLFAFEVLSKFLLVKIRIEELIKFGRLEDYSVEKKKSWISFFALNFTIYVIIRVFGKNLSIIACFWLKTYQSSELNIKSKLFVMWQ